MTHAYIALKDYKSLNANKGDLLVQSDDSSKELGMAELVKKKVFKEINEEEALKIYKQNLTN